MSRAIPADSSFWMNGALFFKVGTIRNTIHAVFWGEADIDVGWECDLLLGPGLRGDSVSWSSSCGQPQVPSSQPWWLTGPHGWKMPQI